MVCLGHVGLFVLMPGLAFIYVPSSVWAQRSFSLCKDLSPACGESARGTGWWHVGYFVQ